MTGQTTKTRARTRQASALRSVTFEDAVPGPDEQASLVASLGTLLRSLRVERGLSTRALAERSILARSTVTRLETGRRRPRPITLEALAFGLDHLDPAPLVAALTEAAGPSLRPDTPGGRQRHERRHRKALRTVQRRRRIISVRAAVLQHRANGLLLDLVHAFPVEPVLTEAEARERAALTLRLQAQRRQSVHLDQCAKSAVSWLNQARHPLDLQSLRWAEQCLTEAAG